MTTTPWFEAISERLNPIVVKEIRQGLRTRVFWVCFSLMLVACLMIALGAWATSLNGRVTDSGQGVFFGFFLCLGAVQFFIIPYTAYRSLAREREEETWVLLSLTGLGARRVLRGKLGSYLVQAALYGSAVLPFLLFSYYLNGIDLPTILVVSGLGFAWTLFLTCAAVCAATMGQSRIVRGLVHFGVLGALLAAAGFAFGITGAIVFDSNSLSRTELWASIGIALWLMLSYGALLFEAAAAQLALPTEDTAKGPRLALILQIIGSALILAWVWNEAGRERVAAMAGLGLFAANLLLVGTFLVSGPSAVHEVHLRRRFWPLLRPGPASAFRLVVALLSLSTAGALALYAGSSDLNERAGREFMLLLALFVFALLYVALPVVVSRVFPVRALATPAGHRALAVVLFGLACTVPPFVAIVLGRQPEDPWVNLFNPVIGLVAYFNAPYRHRVPFGGEEGLLLIAAVALGIGVWADRLLSAAERSARR